MNNNRATKTGGGGRWRLSYATALLILVVVTVYGQVCGFEFLAYDDNLNIYLIFNTYALSVNLWSWLAFHNLDLWYFDHGQMDKAIEQYDLALALKPNSFKPIIISE